MTTRRKFGMGIAAMLVAQRAPAALIRSRVAGRHIAATGTRLPYDAEVEYLESTGTQWIDTGIRNLAIGTSFKFKMLIQFTSVPTNSYAGSGFTSNNKQSFVALNSNSSTGLYMSFCDTAKLATQLANSDKTGSHAYEAIGGGGVVGYYVDGTKVKEYSFSSWTINYFFLFVIAVENGTKNGLTGYQRIYSITIENNGEQIINFQPVRFTNEQGVSEGAMYDRVSGQLFRNVGTGAFVFGPVVARGASAQNGGGV